MEHPPLVQKDRGLNPGAAQFSSGLKKKLFLMEWHKVPLECGLIPATTAGNMLAYQSRIRRHFSVVMARTSDEDANY